MKQLILLMVLVIPSVTFSVSATEGQGSGVLGPEVQCKLQSGSVIQTFAQICIAHKGNSL